MKTSTQNIYYTHRGIHGAHFPEAKREVLCSKYKVKSRVSVFIIWFTLEKPIKSHESEYMAFYIGTYCMYVGR